MTIIGQSATGVSSYFSGISTEAYESRYENIRFYRFPQPSNLMSVGSLIYLRNVSVSNTSGSYLRWTDVSRQAIVNDSDGSLSTLVDGKSRSNAIISPYYPHNYIAQKCTNATNQTRWGDSLICNAGIGVNSIRMLSSDQGI